MIHDDKSNQNLQRILQLFCLFLSLVLFWALDSKLGPELTHRTIKRQLYFYFTFYLTDKSSSGSVSPCRKHTGPVRPVLISLSPHIRDSIKFCSVLFHLNRLRQTNKQKQVLLPRAEGLPGPAPSCSDPGSDSQFSAPRPGSVLILCSAESLSGAAECRPPHWNSPSPLFTSSIRRLIHRHDYMLLIKQLIS